MITHKLPCFGIVVEIEVDEQYNPTSGTITSTDLITKHNDVEDESYNVAVNTIESMILAHAMAEVDITKPSYIQGIETAVEKVSNKY